MSKHTHLKIIPSSTTHTWPASSRVGDMTRALNPLFMGCFRCVKRGIQNASVFPDPVGAEAKSSRPWKKTKKGHCILLKEERQSKNKQQNYEPNPKHISKSTDQKSFIAAF